MKAINKSKCGSRDLYEPKNLYLGFKQIPDSIVHPSKVSLISIFLFIPSVTSHGGITDVYKH